MGDPSIHHAMCLVFVQDRSFTFILKTPPASVLLAKAAGVPKGSGAPNTLKVGKITQAQLKVSHLLSRGAFFVHTRPVSTHSR